MAMFSRSGLTPKLCAICGIEVAIMVESSWAMNRPQAITRGMTGLMIGAAASVGASTMSTKRLSRFCPMCRDFGQALYQPGRHGQDVALRLGQRLGHRLGQPDILA